MMFKYYKRLFIDYDWRKTLTIIIILASILTLIDYVG